MVGGILVICMVGGILVYDLPYFYSSSWVCYFSSLETLIYLDNPIWLYEQRTSQSHYDKWLMISSENEHF